MPLVLILSSHAAASRVGGQVAVSALQARGIDTVFCPTCLLGRHPGHGVPGGGPVPAEQFGSQIEGVAAHGMFGLIDAVLTGYFASVEQVEIAAASIEEIRKAPRGRGDVRAATDRPLIIVDPIMGDNGDLYVSAEIAAAIRDQLIPLADIITPNAFELGWLSGQDVSSLEGILEAPSIAPTTLMTSAQLNGEFGAAFHSGQDSLFAAHQKLDDLPNGMGDFLTAEFLAIHMSGASPKAAFEAAVRNAVDLALKARDWNAFELPDVTARLHPLRDDAVIDLQRLTS